MKIVDRELRSQLNRRYRGDLVQGLRKNQQNLAQELSYLLISLDTSEELKLQVRHTETRIFLCVYSNRRHVETLELLLPFNKLYPLDKILMNVYGMDKLALWYKGHLQWLINKDSMLFEHVELIP